MDFYQFISGDIENNKLPKSEYLYGPRHLCVIAFAILATLALYFIFRRKSDKAKNILYTVIACVFLTFEILSRIQKLVFTADHSVTNVFRILLPLYFCSITVWLLIISVLIKDKALINAASICGVLATTAYLVYPAVGLSARYITFDAFYSISSHTLGFITSYSMILLGYSRYKIRDIWKTYVVFAVIILYGVLMSLFAFPNNDFVMALTNPLGFDTVVPYPLVYAVFIILWVFIFYCPDFVKTLVAKQKERKAA
jgi:hypothetical protein